MRGDIMYTKWQSVWYAVQINLMNDFLESFLLVFGENKCTKLKRYWTTFCYTGDYSPWKIVKIQFSLEWLQSFDKTYLTKAKSKALSPFTKNT